MLFQSRIDRARRLQRELRGLDKSEAEADEKEGDPEAIDIEEPTIRDEMEKGDMAAMLLAGLLSVFLPAAAVLAAVVGFCYLLLTLG